MNFKTQSDQKIKGLDLSLALMTAQLALKIEKIVIPGLVETR